MDRIDQFDIFKLGAACKAVEDLDENPPFAESLTPLLDLRRALAALAEGVRFPCVIAEAISINRQRSHTGFLKR